jgi:tetratricopeptide (TPR) repeat protein
MKPYLPLVCLPAIVSVLYCSVGQALSSVEVGRIAKAVTVTIESAKSPGSGVLIQKSGNQYKVLTAAHVVRDRTQTYKIVLPDGQSYQSTNIKPIKEADLAVVEFMSSASYPVAKMGDPNKSSEGSVVYVAGFPVATQTITAALYNFTEGKVTANASRPLAEGYSLVYSNNTLPGMSGGPVFDDRGELIAIHGRGDVQSSSQASEINQNVRIKTGFNLGITMSTVLQRAKALGLNFGGTPVAVASAPKADDFFLVGVEQFRQGRWVGAIDQMDRAIALRPNYVRAYVARGAARYMLNQIAQGLADMDRALELDGNYANAYVGRCFLLNEFKNQAQALGACDRAIELAPKSAIAYNVRGLVKSGLKDLSGAEQDLRQAIELDPQSYYAYGNLGVVYALRNNPQVALQYTRQALQLNPQSAGMRTQLGTLLVLTKEYQQAIGELNRAIGMNPQISSAYEFRALAYEGLGNVNGARIDRSTAQAVSSASPQGFIEDLSFLNQ